MNAPVTPAKPVSPTPGKPTGPVSTSPSASAPKVFKGAAPFAIKSSQTHQERWFKILVYAEPGIGKTTLLASASDVPDMTDILFIDCEKGYIVIEDNDRIKNPNAILDNRIPCDNFKTVAQVHDFLKGHCKHRDENNVAKLIEQEAWLRGVDASEIKEPKRFRSVMIDSLSEVDIYCNYQILGVTQEKVLDESSGDVDVAGWPEFRKNNQMMQMLCRAFRDLPIHVLCSAHRTYAEDEKKRRYYSPQLTGQLRTQIPGFFDMVGYMTTEKVGDNLERRMYVKPVGSTNFTAKNRRPLFKGDYFKDPTMSDIMKGIGLLK